MKFLDKYDKWLKNKCDSLPQKRQQQIVIGILIVYVLLTIITVLYLKF